MEEESQSEPLMELEPPTIRTAGRSRSKHRRRRRSSARFLRLTGRLMEDEEEDEEEEEPIESEQHLGDMYKKAIRMNVENRINASNSWNLRLIENIDKFLEEEPVESDSPNSSRSSSPVQDENGDPLTDATNNSGGILKRGKHNKEKRVNFTKASCTLDASVKIYSYRVDDVHLTSYKVLANLNRTDNKEKSAPKQSRDVGSAQTQDDGGDGLNGDLDDGEGPSKSSSKNTGTLETNVANINMNKLDSAFDIDPLFHKMSKTFDEGGAKGLLLVNLGVGDKGCNIVFDSKAECEEEDLAKATEDPVDGSEEGRQEGLVDISSLVAKLDSSVGIHSVESLSLVPQLASLREQFAQLQEEGFVEKSSKASRRYASTKAEEKEADMSIHQEAIERSRVSQGLGRSFATHDDDDDDDAPQFAPDDFGGGADDDDDDVGFDNFIANMDDNEARFSSISFRDSFAPAGHNNDKTSSKSQADVLLDAICSGNNVLGAGEYEYFDTQALETAMAGNLWAGSTHWKRTEPARRRQEKDKKKKTTKRTKKSKTKAAACVDLTASPVLEDILRKPPKGKRGANPLQLSKAMVTKYTKESNLLPPDSGMGVEKLAGLFLRPNVIVQPSNNAPAKGKTVCFDAAVETFGAAFDDGVDDSFGGEDDGTGFGFADDNDNENDFVMEELKAVRKVDTKSVQVGYATVAKKVDVRRLKRDLWTGIESSIAPVTPRSQEEKEEGDLNDDDDDSMMKTPERSTPEEGGGLSFQNTVREMEESKAQVDVTLPFYFICVLHLANEKGLRLESTGLQDFVIHDDTKITAPSV